MKNQRTNRDLVASFGRDDLALIGNRGSAGTASLLFSCFTVDALGAFVAAHPLVKKEKEMLRLSICCAGLLIGSAALAQNVIDGSPPERDARGIPVISAPAQAPAGANQWTPPPAGASVVPAPNQAAVFATRPGAQEYPPCTATVTDNCVQAYVGRNRRPGRR